MLTREQILQADDLARVPVDVPEWGGRVFVRAMTGAERERFETRVGTEKTRVIPLLVAMTACDEAGTAIFTEADVEALAGKSVKALYRLHEAALGLNKLGPADVDTAEKN